MKKRYIAIAAAALMMFPSIASADNNITVNVNGRKIQFDTQPFIKNDRTLVPLRAIAEAMDFDVDWNQEMYCAEFSNCEKAVTVEINSDVIHIENFADDTITSVQIDAPAIIVNDRTYLPLRALVEAFGADVDWNGETYTVNVEYAGLNIKIPIISGVHVSTTAPKVTEAPVKTQAPIVTETPVETQTPIVTEAPVETPIVTEAPKKTAAPTTVPIATKTPIVFVTPKPVQTDKPDTSSDLEKLINEVIEIVNEERAAYNLSPLKGDALLNKTAQQHSEDMAKNNFFDHTNLNGQSPFDRLRKNGVSYFAAGENIAYGQTSPKSVMQSWMNSSGHRANILSSKFGKIGVGIAKNASGRIYWTQVFTD